MYDNTEEFEHTTPYSEAEYAFLSARSVRLPWVATLAPPDCVKGTEVRPVTTGFLCVGIPEPEGLSTGAIYGIVIGGLVLLFILFAVYGNYRARQRQAIEDQFEDDTTFNVKILTPTLPPGQFSR